MPPDNEPEFPQPATGRMRLLWAAGGWFFVGVGTLGIFLPLITVNCAIFGGARGRGANDPKAALHPQITPERRLIATFALKRRNGIAGCGL